VGGGAEGRQAEADPPVVRLLLVAEDRLDELDAFRKAADEQRLVFQGTALDRAGVRGVFLGERNEEPVAALGEVGFEVDVLP
jgi:hypothetical protein